MATTTLSPPVAPTTVRSPYRFSVAQYHQMGETGILKDGEKVELLEGLLVEKMPHNPPHAKAITKIPPVMYARLPEGWLLRTQLPITLSESEPEPDFVVAMGPLERYDLRHPGSAEAALVIEVSDSTLAQDRDDKKRIYARARLPIYWIVNIPEAQIEVYTQPRAGRNPTYRQRRDYLPDESIPLVIAGQEVGSIPVRDLLP